MSDNANTIIYFKSGGLDDVFGKTKQTNKQIMSFDFIGHKLLAGGFLTYILSKEILILHDEVHGL